MTENIAAIIAGKLLDERFVQVEASARHVHLCAADLEILFGRGAALTPARELSQKGEFLSEQRVSIVTERRTLQNVAVLGPVRSASQVELSLTDGVSLGLNLEVKDSGNISGTPGVLLRTETGEVRLSRGCIAAGRHLHAPPDAAGKLGLRDGQLVSVEIPGSRRTVYHDVLVRVRDTFRLRVHLDMDEANAAGISGFTLGRIII